MKTSSLKKLPQTAVNLLSLSVLFAAFGAQAAPSANGCEVVFADSKAAILRANTLTGGPALVSQNQKLIQPFGVAVGLSGEVYVSDTGCSGLIGINPATGEQRLVSSGGNLGFPLGIAVEANGSILVANTAALVRVNPDSGEQSIISSGNLFQVPLAVTTGDHGDIYVVDALGAVIQVDGATGAQKLVAKGGYLHRPQGIALSGKNIYVTDVAAADGNFGVGRIIQINIQNGRQTVLSEGANLVGPVGITIEPSGHLVVADPYTMNPDSTDVFDGGIIRVNSKTGEQTLIARGSDTFVNPRGVAVVPGSTAN